jgi:hypothetical protein
MSRAALLAPRIRRTMACSPGLPALIDLERSAQRSDSTDVVVLNPVEKQCAPFADYPG